MIARRSVLLAPLLLTACSKRKGARPLFAAESQPADYPTTQGLFALDRFLNESTNGEMRIRVYPGGQLGAEKDTLELAVFGGIDITRVNLGPITSIAPLTSVLALPFLFRSISHARATFDGSVGRTILDSLSEHGLRGLCFYDSGARSFYSTQRPIRAPEDMVGMKVRVPNSDIYVQMIRALGANATPIPFGEVYQALVQGVWWMARRITFPLMRERATLRPRSFTVSLGTSWHQRCWLHMVSAGTKWGRRSASSCKRVLSDRFRL